MRLYEALRERNWDEIETKIRERPNLLNERNKYSWRSFFEDLVMTRELDRVEAILAHIDEKTRRQIFRNHSGYSRAFSHGRVAFRNLLWVIIVDVKNDDIFPLLEFAFRHCPNHFKLLEDVWGVTLWNSVVNDRLNLACYIAEKMRSNSVPFGEDSEHNSASLSWFVENENFSTERLVRWLTALAPYLPNEITRKYESLLGEAELDLITNSFEVINDGQSLPSAVLGVVMQQTSLVLKGTCM